MTSITRRVLLHPRRASPRIPVRCSAPKPTIQWQRSLSSTAPRFDDPPNSTSGQTPKAESKPVAKSTSKRKAKRAAPLTEDEERALQFATLRKDLERLDPDVEKAAKERGEQGMPWLDNYELTSDEDFEIAETKGRRDGFWSEGEEAMGPDEDYYGDDLTSLGHAELEQHRDVRQYARLAAWELPLLSRTPHTPFSFSATFNWPRP
ncbi:uncharacterized protein BDR25DRAFT_231674 [Lindgomyces ingoldianus]|uniref:Uncharacterized protein n=1 Tax=Lindgomyces ingoldianus TaxID=673940 RepID=A0ACB6QQA6_9PLEO|nr:uncharacterized protein BDR25DRAFT_231674 [Lindgomyces ingoldianus]KAF2468462.1 hypothetical protein BDR25DRAFT_231674 [Lindgomyces ingoldianus]